MAAIIHHFIVEEVQLQREVVTPPTRPSGPRPAASLSDLRTVDLHTSDKYQPHQPTLQGLKMTLPYSRLPARCGP